MLYHTLFFRHLSIYEIKILRSLRVFTLERKSIRRVDITIMYSPTVSRSSTVVYASLQE